MKQVYVILSFHAHEPLWDFPGQLQALADREEIRSGVTAENYLRRRKEEGRDIYLDLLAMGRRMNIPLCLEASNELLFQLAQITPETFAKLKAAFHEGALHTILGHAHHTHITLLTEEEIYDELRLNAEFYREEMWVTLPAVLGAFPLKGRDSHKTRGLPAFWPEISGLSPSPPGQVPLPGFDLPGRGGGVPPGGGCLPPVPA